MAQFVKLGLLAAATSHFSLQSFRGKVSSFVKACAKCGYGGRCVCVMV